MFAQILGEFDHSKISLGGAPVGSIFSAPLPLNTGPSCGGEEAL
jgi:hypothetical protein